ncbi:MAG: glycosyltransferase [Planctomycetota bacterium]|nr:glycosyltransferase [Planctomycetota bacterium]MDA1114006.1 glycosyltransferase [Planctomycetota bacterium]
MTRQHPLRFSVFVPTLKRPDLLRRNLEALALQSRLPDEVLVSLRADLDPEGVETVDNFIQHHSKMNIVKVMLTEPGIVVAENAILNAATGDVGCLLDDDAIARPFWLENIARHYENDARVGGVAGPAINFINGKPEPRHARFRNRVIFPGLIMDQSTRHTDGVVEVDHYRGANMSLRLEPLRKAGGFDANLRGDCFRFEMDACLGVKRQGFRLLFDPEVEVDHHEAPRVLNTERFDATAIFNNAANETYALMKGYGPIGRFVHMVFALLVGNFPCPGLAWGVGGGLLGLVWKNRNLFGMGAIMPAWKGRFEGCRMFLRWRAEQR